MPKENTRHGELYFNPAHLLLYLVSPPLDRVSIFPNVHRMK
jgi:hypothetical protein